MLRNRFVPLALVGLLTAACAGPTQVGGPGPAAPSSQVVRPIRGNVPAGTELWVELDERISAKRNRVGDRFTAVVQQDVLDPDGEPLIPRGARVHGQIVELRRGGVREPAAVRLVVDTLEIEGMTQPLSAGIVQTEVPRSLRKSVRGRDVAVGAGAGALIGAILEGGKGAVVGGLVGAGAGTLVSLGTSGNQAELPRGTEMALELQRPVRSLATLRPDRRYR